MNKRAGNVQYHTSVHTFILLLAACCLFAFLWEGRSKRIKGRGWREKMVGASCGVMGWCKSINVIFLLIVLVLVYFIRFCHGCIRFCYLVEWQNIINGLTFNNKSYFAGCFWWLFLDTVFLL